MITKEQSKPFLKKKGKIVVKRIEGEKGEFYRVSWLNPWTKQGFSFLFSTLLSAVAFAKGLWKGLHEIGELVLFFNVQIEIEYNPSGLKEEAIRIEKESIQGLN